MTRARLVKEREVGTDAPTQKIDVIRVDRGPISGIAADPDGRRLVVTNYGDDSVTVIDTEARAVADTVPGLTEPFALALGNGVAYVSIASDAYDSIAAIDLATNAVVASHPLALKVSDLAVSPDGRYVYAGRDGARGADVAILDTTTNRVEVVDLAGLAAGTVECVRIGPDGTRLYVGVNGPTGGRLLVIDTSATAGRRVVGSVEIESAVRDVAVSPDSSTIYVASCGAEFAAVVDVVDARTNEVTGTRKIGEIGGLVTQLSLGADGARAYLVSEDRVTVLCPRTQDVLGTIRVAQPSCAVESVDGDCLYIADHAGSVTVAPVGVCPDADLDEAAIEGGDPLEWALSELPQLEPALL